MDSLELELGTFLVSTVRGDWRTEMGHGGEDRDMIGCGCGTKKVSMATAVAAFLGSFSSFGTASERLLVRSHDGYPVVGIRYG